MECDNEMFGADEQSSIFRRIARRLVLSSAVALLVPWTATAQAGDFRLDSPRTEFQDSYGTSYEYSGKSDPFSWALKGHFAGATDQLNYGFGAGFSGYYLRLAPIVPAAGLDLVISSLDVEGLPGPDFLTFMSSLDVEFRASPARIRPYLAAGIHAHFNHLIFDQPADVDLAGYDSTTQAMHMEVGWGIAPHLRLGMLVRVNRNLTLLLESRFMSVTGSADIDYHNRTSGDRWTGTLDYDMPRLWISIGVIGAR